jgi:hypothetical protein
VTIRPQVDEGFTVTAMSVRRAVVASLPGWVTVGARCDVLRRRVRVWLDGPWWRRTVARRGGRARMLQAAVLAGNALVDEAIRRGLEFDGVILEVGWR